MDINLADVTLHVDQTLSEAELEQLEQAFRQRDGVLSFHINPDKPHLLLLEYNPARVQARDLLDILRYQGLKGELVGL